MISKLVPGNASDIAAGIALAEEINYNKVEYRIKSKDSANS